MAAKENQENHDEVINPFSFSNFIKKEDKDSSTKQQQQEEEINKSVIEDGAQHNPFSYQNFNNGNKQTKSTNRQKPKKLQIVDDVEDLGDDIFANVNTPRKTKKKKEKCGNQSSSDKSSLLDNLTRLDNTTITPELPNDNIDQELIPQTDDVSTEELLSDDDEDDDDDDDDDADSLSESPQADTYVLENTISENDESLLQQLQMLKKENTELRDSLEKVSTQYKEHRESTDKKIKSLRTELEKARKKEVEDTKALEGVVRMVEQNLQTTTERAVRAEQTVTKIREELKQSRENQVSMSDYQNLQLQHYHLLNTIQERSRDAAQLMRKAAEKSQPHLQQMQSGIQSLLFLAEQLDSIGMIAEIPKTNQPHNI